VNPTENPTENRDAPTAIEDIRALDPPTLVARMRVGVEAFDPRLFELGDEDLDRAWTPASGAGRWPIRVLLGHLADTELLSASRLRMVFALDSPTLPPFDEHAYIDSGIYGCTDGVAIRPPVGGDVAAIHTTRCWAVAFLFQLDESAWARRALHPERGPTTMLGIAQYQCWHLEHHAWFLNRKIERILGPAPDPGPCGAGGCEAPGCACARTEHDA